MKKISIAVINENGVPEYQTETMEKQEAFDDIREYVQGTRPVMEARGISGPYYYCPTCKSIHRDRRDFHNFCSVCGQKLYND